ncbi:MAG: tRNA (adenosine(37)-N6)-threonylcarbamoyltransferase complex dimerization subunit type 1 TsaB [Anaerolineaceae bacterium]|nr:tRNA (adenosine(37)-N6)-threonylcarbamoyltransferase complex dimerization subunit type 1 TsaB [Anaerolineaceae bacterium]
MLLAVDTSTQTIGLALYDGAQVAGEMTWQTKTHHTVELAPAVDDLLKRCNVKPTDLQAIACGLGPGSFTSLRIGLALAKGMALSLKIPLLGIPTLDYLAAQQPLLNMPMAAILPAGRSRLAVGWYENKEGRWESLGAATIITAEDLSAQINQPTYICGEFDAEERQTLSRKWKNAVVATPAHCLRHPAMLAELAWKRFQAGEQDEPISLAPIYLHVAEAIPD